MDGNFKKAWMYFQSLMKRLKKPTRKNPSVRGFPPYRNAKHPNMRRVEDDYDSDSSLSDFSLDGDIDTKAYINVKRQINRENTTLLKFIVGEWFLKIWATFFTIALQFQMGCVYLLSTGFLGLFFVSKMDRRNRNN